MTQLVDHLEQPPFRVVVFFSGRGSNLGALLHYFEHHPRVHIVAGLTDNPSSTGLEALKKFQVPAVIVPREKGVARENWGETLLKETLPFSPDLVVLAGFMRILPTNVIEALPHRVINIHPSLLPDFPGLNAPHQAIQAGVKRAGCTVHYVTAGVDEGPIIEQSALEVLPDETAESLAARILKLEHKLLPAVVEKLAKR